MLYFDDRFHLDEGVRKPRCAGRLPPWEWGGEKLPILPLDRRKQETLVKTYNIKRRRQREWPLVLFQKGR